MEDKEKKDKEKKEIEKLKKELEEFKLGTKCATPLWLSTTEHPSFIEFVKRYGSTNLENIRDRMKLYRELKKRGADDVAEAISDCRIGTRTPSMIYRKKYSAIFEPMMSTLIENVRNGLDGKDLQKEVSSVVLGLTGEQNHETLLKRVKNTLELDGITKVVTNGRTHILGLKKDLETINTDPQKIYEIKTDADLQKKNKGNKATPADLEKALGQMLLYQYDATLAELHLITESALTDDIVQVFKYYNIICEILNSEGKFVRY